MPFAEEPILTQRGIQRLDQRLDRTGLLELAMEEAGRAVADAAYALKPEGHILLLAGGGANGGDALVAARHLLALGCSVEVLALSSKHQLTRLQVPRLEALGLTLQPLVLNELNSALERADLVVDGLFGIGFKPPFRGELGQVIQRVNQSKKEVLAIDLPSGLSSEQSDLSGEMPIIQAKQTVTLSGLKPVLLFGKGVQVAGQIQLARLRLPVAWVREEACAVRPAFAQLAKWLPQRGHDAHKGIAGRVWIIGGQPGMVGAPALAGLGALRAGAGLVTVYSSAQVPLITPELMIEQHEDLQATLLKRLKSSSKPYAMAIGMGLGRQAALLAVMLLKSKLPLVIDADALQPQLAGLGHEHTIWTPHLGEAARLLDCSIQYIQKDPIQAAQQIQKQFGGVVVLKGAPSVVVSAKQTWVSRGGHPGMASAGMGDTLAGLIAAFCGQGLSAERAAVVGVHLHALAGEKAAKQYGNGLLASDVSEALGGAWLGLEDHKSK